MDTERGTGTQVLWPTDGLAFGQDGALGRDGAFGLEGTVWLETPILRFVDVAQGQSKLEPIMFRSIGPGPPGLDVVIPPLAPFSLVVSPRRPFSSSFSSFSPIDGSGTAGEGESRTELWVRYDATSAMAIDIGQVTVRDRTSGREWRIELDGTGNLAHQI